MASLWLVTLSPAWARNVLNFSRAEGMLTARNVAPAGLGCQCDPMGEAKGIARVRRAELNRALALPMIVGVHPLAGFDKVLHYRVPDSLRPHTGIGTLVRVPVGRAIRIGVVGTLGPPKDFPL